MEEKNINTLLDQMKSQFNCIQSEESSLEMFSADKKPEEMHENDKPKSTESEDYLKGNVDDDSNTETSSIREVPEIKPPQNTNKRSSRRRSSGYNKSVIQNAIARKEKSFEDYTKPKRKIRKISKASDITDDKKDDTAMHLKRIQKSPNASKKPKNLEGEPELPASATQEDDSNLRRSQRSLLSENQDDILEEELESEEAILKKQIGARLCKCTENRGILSESDRDSQFCAGMDTIDKKLMGCNRLVNVKTVPLLRSSARVAFSLFCDAHRQRLTKHNCCSTCGVFCTQGHFQECPSKHHFHKDCKLTVGNKDYCPHCGDAAPSRDVKITMHTAKPPIFLPEQRAHHTAAKMRFESNSDHNTDTHSLISPDNLKDLIRDASACEATTSCTEYDLVEAIESDDVKRFAAIMGSPAIDVQRKFEEYNDGTLLHLAATKGNLQMAHLLVSSAVDVDSFDKDQNTPLMLATIEQKNLVVKYLTAKAGADVSLKGIDGMTALHVAAKCGNLEACQLILASSFAPRDFINAQDDGGWTPLVWACENGFVDVAKFCVSKGADVNKRDVEHNVALHWAAFRGSSDIIELLLSWKCDVNVVNVHGDTPLHITAREDRYNSALILLSRGADVTIINKNNETPLDCVPRDGNCVVPLTLHVQLSTNNGKQRKNILSNDISKGRELNPIQCFNNVDSENEPSDYNYVRASCVTTETIQIDMRMTKEQSCSCEDRCMSFECECTKRSEKCWYDGEGKVLPDFRFYDSPMIFECNDRCSCNAILCVNRLIQKPLTQRFELFRTVAKGWGVRTLNSIAQGNYVCEYVGEILTDTEADYREDDSYLFDLDNKDADSFCIDAKFYGNIARFINHSCDPNLHPVKVFVDHHDLRFPRIAFFAKKDIPQNEEISFDYGHKFWLVKYKTFTCECGSDLCRYSEENIRETLDKIPVSAID